MHWRTLIRDCLRKLLITYLLLKKWLSTSLEVLGLMMLLAASFTRTAVFMVFFLSSTYPLPRVSLSSFEIPCFLINPSFCFYFLPPKRFHSFSSYLKCISFFLNYLKCISAHGIAHIHALKIETYTNKIHFFYEHKIHSWNIYVCVYIYIFSFNWWIF